MNKTPYEISIWIDKSVPASYSLTKDTVAQANVYYITDFAPINISATVNPAEKGYYILEGQLFTLSHDTTPQNCIYYQQLQDSTEYHAITIDRDTPLPLLTSNTNVAVYDKHNSFLHEEKFMTIGSDTMVSPNRATHPVLVRDINGTNTLTFDMVTQYVDNRTGEKVRNPFVDYLLNETKIKVQWQDKWYDFIVKDSEEGSVNNTVSYTCTDQYINELSKTGFNIEFDIELSNNVGTAGELIGETLKDTDWRLTNDIPNINQKLETGVYETALRNDLEVVNALTQESSTLSQGVSLLIPFESVPADVTIVETQLIYTLDSTWKKDDSSMVIQNGENTFIELEWIKDSAGDWNALYNGVLVFVLGQNALLSTDYRAERLVKSQESKYDATTKRSVLKYHTKDGIAAPYSGLDIWGYTSTKWIDPTMITNFMINGEYLQHLEGWADHSSNTKLPIRLEAHPVLPVPLVTPYNPINFLVFQKGGAFTNDAIYTSRGVIASVDTDDDIVIKQGNQFILRYKTRNNFKGNPDGEFITTPVLIPSVEPLNDAAWEGEIFEYDDTTIPYKDGWNSFVLTACRNVSLKEIKAARPRFKFIPTADGGLESIQWYNRAYGLVTNPETEEQSVQELAPGQYDESSVGLDYYTYYYYEQDAKEPTYIHQDFSDLETLEPTYPTNPYEKIRSITTNQSNRFNILQQIAETFEVWLQFEIAHNEDGSLVYDDGVPIKTVHIIPELLHEIGYGFVYGKDLNGINRKINSDEIATKIIVPDIQNDDIETKLVSIARADENYAHSNFILDFGYYINQQFLDGSEVMKDLYSNLPNHIGYYYWLHHYNLEYNKYTDEYNSKKNELLKLTNQQEILEGLLASVETKRTTVWDEIVQFVNGTNIVKDGEEISYILSLWSESSDVADAKIKSYYAAWVGLNNQATDIQQQIDILNVRIAALDEYIDSTESRKKELIELIKAKDLEFWRKYSRYIQEGTWTDTNYLDDAKYYMDGMNIAYTSSRPQIQYDIQVIRLNALSEFRYKIFNLADKTYIQDTDFFGYEADGITPYKQEVIVSQIVYNFDTPNEDSITVQNYKTQFEDLFQRITATTQQLTFAQPQYKAMSSNFNDGGVLKTDALQDALDYNNQLVLKAQNDLVKWDNTGVTVTDLTDPNKLTRLTSGGIFVSRDGGTTWLNAISSHGVSTANLTAGQINPERITILSGKAPTFRWDSRGISAMDYQNIGDGIRYSEYKFARMDQFGFYGINGQEWNSFLPLTIKDVVENQNTQFYLGWDGFFLRGGDNSYILTSDNSVIEDKTYYTLVSYAAVARPQANPYLAGYYTYDGQQYTLVPHTETTVQPDTIYYAKTAPAYKAIVNPIGDPAAQGWYELIIQNEFGIDNQQGFYVSHQNTPRILLGDLTPRYNTQEHTYGLRINNNVGEPILEASNGDIWLQNLLKVGGNTDVQPQVVIGYNPEESATPFNKFSHEVINANDKFKVWEDGSMQAIDGSFTGEIYAKSGQIGNLTIEALESAVQSQSSFKVDTLTSNFFLVDDTGRADPLELRFEAVYVGYQPDSIEWSVGSSVSGPWTKLGEGIQYSLAYNIDNFINSNICYLKTELKGTQARPIYTAIRKMDKPNAADINIYNIATSTNLIQAKYHVDKDSTNEILIDPMVNISALLNTTKEDLGDNQYFTLEFLDTNSELTNPFKYITYPQTENVWISHFNSALTFNPQEDVSYSFITQLDSNTLTFDFQAFFNMLLWYQHDDISDYSALSYQHFLEILLTGQFVIRLKYWVDDIAQVEQLLTIQLANSYYDAKFALWQDSIIQSVENNKLVFSSEGLELTNAKFTIGDENTTYFTFDPKAQDPKLQVTGKMQIDDGKFTGHITATSGTVGGITIKEQSIKADDFTLSSTEGIIADKIQIGANAHITDYLQIGNAYIYNPNLHDRLFIKAGDTSITDTGLMQLGQIRLDGAQSQINGSNWSITNHQAAFSNVSVAGELSTVAFTNQTIQSVGSTLILKSHYRATSVEYDSANNTLIFTIPGLSTLSPDITKVWVTISGPEAVWDTKSIILTRNAEGGFVYNITTNNPLNTIIARVFGVEGDFTILQNRVDELLFIYVADNTIQTTEILTLTGDTHHFLGGPQSLTITKVNRDDASIRATPTLVLGLLDENTLNYKIPETMLNTYGLYAENVFLKGQLSASSIIQGQNIYSGIHTDSNVSMSDIDQLNLPQADDSPIVFYGGAVNDTINPTVIDYSSANFIVTQAGSVKATNAYLQGSLIADSYIEGAILKTAKIIGTGYIPTTDVKAQDKTYYVKENHNYIVIEFNINDVLPTDTIIYEKEASLVIEENDNISDGIVFKTNKNGQLVETLKIAQDKMSFKGTDFISFAQDETSQDILTIQNLDNITTRSINIEDLIIHNNIIANYKSNLELDINDSFDFIRQGITDVSISATATEIHNNMQLFDNLELINVAGGKNISYKKASDKGYDLFIN